MKNMKPEEARTATMERPSEAPEHPSHEESLTRVVEAIKEADHYIVLCLKDLSETKIQGTFTIYGNNMRLIQTLVEYIDDNPELGVLFKLMQLRHMLNSDNE